MEWSWGHSLFFCCVLCNNIQPFIFLIFPQCISIITLLCIMSFGLGLIFPSICYFSSKKQQLQTFSGKQPSEYNKRLFAYAASQYMHFVCRFVGGEKNDKCMSQLAIKVKGLFSCPWNKINTSFSQLPPCPMFCCIVKSVQTFFMKKFLFQFHEKVSFSKQFKSFFKNASSSKLQFTKLRKGHINSMKKGSAGRKTYFNT